jgi:DNA polymerase-3 subunit epsilon
MRQIILDTETTGLDPRTGDRIVEIGCVELVNRKLTGNNFHRYINPERDSDPRALEVHGLTTEFLSDKPKFGDIADELSAYIQGAEVIIHNAPFDLGFLEAEYQKLGKPAFARQIGGVIDTLVRAKEMNPGKRNSLDALCERFGISNAHRQLHGALLDAELLADVYLAMTRGQKSLVIDDEPSTPSQQVDTAHDLSSVSILVRSADEAELEAHDKLLAGLAKSGKCLWLVQ